MRKMVIVNGDDMAFKCPRDFNPFFDAVAAEAGFRLSVGKDYLSEHTVLINSQIFTRKNGLMTRMGYLNQRLLTGVNIKSGDSQATPIGISRDLNKMFSMIGDSSFLPMAMRRFPKFENERFSPNWFLPVHLGGCGIDLNFMPDSCRLTRNQRIVAHKMVENPTTLYYVSGGPKVPTKVARHALPAARPVFGPYVPNECESDSLDSPWLERLALFTRMDWAGCTAQQNYTAEVRMREIVLWRPKMNGKRRKIAPYTMEDILLRWFVRHFSYPGPLCPPLEPLRPPPLAYDADLQMRFHPDAIAYPRLLKTRTTDLLDEVFCGEAFFN